MSLSLEQFNSLTTKSEHSELKKEVGEINDKIDKVIDTLDFLVKKYEDHEMEHAANIGAHDRIEGRLEHCEHKLELQTV